MSQPPKDSLNFSEYQALFLQIRATEQFMRSRAEVRRVAGLVIDTNPGNWWADADEINSVLSAFGIPASPDWAETRRRVVLSAAGAENKCTFPGLLRVMAEVRGLIRLCQMINVVPGPNAGDPPQPRAITNQELVSFFCAYGLLARDR